MSLREAVVDWDYYDDGLVARLGPMHKGRRLIVPNAPITGGVLFAAENNPVHREEALVIDPNEDPDPYDQFYLKVLARIRENGIIRERRLPGAVHDLAREQFPRSGAVAHLLQLIAAEHGLDVFPDGLEVNLGRLMRAGVGNCRHHAALEICTVERLVTDGLVASVDNVSLESNRVMMHGKRRAHAWGRWMQATYRNPVIVDSINDTYGTLELMYSERQGNYIWPYWRPEDEQRFTGAMYRR